MASPLVEGLVADATLVAEVGVRLGALENSDLLDNLAAINRTPGDGTGPDPAIVASLQRSLNAALKAIAPITLGDLHRGWRPYRSTGEQRAVTVLFFVLSIVLMAACAYTTQVYERARAMYATTLELQEARGAEQAMRLFGMLKRNQEDVVESLNTGKKEFLYEVFSKALFDLKAMYLKNLAYLPISSVVLNDLEMIASPAVAIDRIRNSTNPAGDTGLEKIIAQPNYSSTPPESIGDEIAKIAKDMAASEGTDPKHALDVQMLLESYLGQLRRFNQSINVSIDPLQPNDYFSTLFRLRIGIGFVGMWVLPALYGMLGGIIFHMRRLLNPAVPDPPWMRIIFRVLLGAFAGIIVVWFWTPSTQKISQGEFVTLTSFGLAFLVGFSTDVFFRALDRLVEYLTQAVGGPVSQ
jgi:hypothetical protein